VKCDEENAAISSESVTHFRQLAFSQDYRDHCGLQEVRTARDRDHAQPPAPRSCCLPIADFELRRSAKGGFLFSGDLEKRHCEGPHRTLTHPPPPSLPTPDVAPGCAQVTKVLSLMVTLPLATKKAGPHRAARP
jgi:hypothetical protein